MSASLQHAPSLLPAPVGETPSAEARRPLPRHRDSPKYRLFFLPAARGSSNSSNIPSSSSSSSSNNRGLSAALMRGGGVASIAAEETLQQQHNGTIVKREAPRRITIRRSSMEHPQQHNVKPAVIPTNIVQWLEHACPSEILPKVLAFCGPQKSWNLMKTNRFWYHLITNDATWRVMCEETYKWKEGDSWPTTTSWRDYYRLNPCVPVDFSTVHKAMTVACQPPISAQHAMLRPAHFPQRQSVRILLRPGKHYLKEAIVIHSTHDVHVTIETMEMPMTLFSPSDASASSRATTSPYPKQNQESAQIPTVARAPTRQLVQRTSSFQRMMMWNGCRSNHAVDETEVEEETDVVMESPSQEAADAAPQELPLKRATLIMRTRRHNEPIIRVRQGHLKIVNVDLHHNSYGIDIWNGNAAVQVQPPMVSDELPMAVDPRPSIELLGVEVMSRSGRGIVNIDGGYCIIRGCYIHDCAATGIYVGGPGSQAHIETTDVLQNGNGNRGNRRGIGRGHSGIYLEQGQALIRDCNISRNSLTGVSAISPDNAFLSLEGCDLVANGTFQLEMPNLGSVARRRSITRDNNLAVVGLARSRSGLVNGDAAAAAAADEQQQHTI